MKIDYERVAELDSGVRELAKRLGFTITEVVINDDLREGRTVIGLQIEQMPKPRPKDAA